MSVQLNHTVVLARDNKQGAEFLAHILGVEVGSTLGPFVTVPLANDVTLDFYTVAEHSAKFAHFAFLVSESEFDGCFYRLKDAGVAFYADPHLSVSGKINHNDGGRGVYFLDPTGNTMEIITRPYGGWSKKYHG